MKHNLFGCLISLIAVQSFAVEPPGPVRNHDSVSLDSQRLRVHFIDVGAGLAILVQTPGDRKTLFVDGGDQGYEKLRDYIEHFVPGNRIDSLIVTHADQDHFYNASRLLDPFDFGEFVYSGYTSPTIEGLVRWPAFLERVHDEPGIEIHVPAADSLPLGFVELFDDGGTPEAADDDVLITYLNVDASPPDRDPVSNRSFDEGQRRNNASLVFKLSYRGVSFLITGDINGRDREHIGDDFDAEIDSEEAELLDRHGQGDEFSLRATVLQVPHHGSNGSSSIKFLNAVDADWAVISAGHKHNHPTPDALRRIRLSGIESSHILRTDCGDSTPETNSRRDQSGDDSYIFVVGNSGIASILRVRVR